MHLSNVPETRVSGSKCDVSIIIANWNGEKLLGDCLTSIYKLTKSVSFEVIVSDDVSPDGSVDFVRQHFPQAILQINDRNSGFARTNNAALPQVRGRYLLLLNNDTILENDAISALAETLDQRPEVGICGGLLVNSDGSLQHAYGAFPNTFTELARAFGIQSRGKLQWWPNLAVTPRPGQKLTDVGYIVGAGLMIRTELAQKLGLFDEGFEAYFEDTDLCYRAHQAGWRVVFTSSARIIHLFGASYGNEATIPSERKLGLMERGFVRFCRKHYSPARVAWVLMLHRSAYALQIGILKLRLRVEPARRHLRWRGPLKANEVAYKCFQEAKAIKRSPM